MFLSKLARSKTMLDVILIDGNHEYEFASFDLAFAAKMMRAGGVIIMDNAEQTGPFEAARQFLAENPDWRELGSCVSEFKPSTPFAMPRCSIPGPASSCFRRRSVSRLAPGCDRGAMRSLRRKLNLPALFWNVRRNAAAAACTFKWSTVVLPKMGELWKSSSSREVWRLSWMGRRARSSISSRDRWCPMSLPVSSPTAITPSSSRCYGKPPPDQGR